MPDPSELGAALSLYNAATGNVNSLWAVFIALATAVLTLASGGKWDIGGRRRAILALGFLLFGIANHVAIASTQTLRLAAVQVAHGAAASPDAPGSEPYRAMLRAVAAAPVATVRWVHVAAVCAVLVGIAIMQLRIDRVRVREEYGDDY